MCAPAQARTERLMVSMGDSLADQDWDYPALAAGRLLQPGPWQIDRHRQLGVAGATSAALISVQLPAALAEIRGPSDTRVVTIGIGSNDALTIPACMSAPATAACPLGANLKAILRAVTGALRADPGRERLVLVAPYNPWSGTGSPAEAIAQHALLGSDGRRSCAVGPQAGGSDMLTCLAVRNRAALLDLEPIFRGRALELTGISRGDLHLNKEGQQMAGAALLRLLGRR